MKELQVEGVVLDNQNLLCRGPLRVAAGDLPKFAHVASEGLRSVCGSGTKSGYLAGKMVRNLLKSSRSRLICHRPPSRRSTAARAAVAGAMAALLLSGTGAAHAQ